MIYYQIKNVRITRARAWREKVTDDDNDDCPYFP